MYHTANLIHNRMCQWATGTRKNGTAYRWMTDCASSNCRSSKGYSPSISGMRQDIRRQAARAPPVRAPQPRAPPSYTIGAAGPATRAPQPRAPQPIAPPKLTMGAAAPAKRASQRPTKTAAEICLVPRAATMGTRAPPGPRPAQTDLSSLMGNLRM